jgi:hypothetical protein
MQVAAANLVSNGGFETRLEQTGFPAGWRKHKFGDADGEWWTTLNRSGPHAGRYAVVVRSLGEGVGPGILTSIPKLPAGSYELAVWACADAGQSARISARVGEEDLDSRAVQDEYVHVKWTVTIPDDKRNASIGIWADTPKVRVWLDDVTVKAAR